jgi:hypothetical protein
MARRLIVPLGIIIIAMGCTPAPADRAPGGPGAGAAMAGVIDHHAGAPGSAQRRDAGSFDEDGAALALGAEVAQAAAQTAAAGTLRYRLVVSAQTGGGISPLLSVHGERDRATRRGALRVEGQLGGTGAFTAGQPLEAVTDNDDVYLRGTGDAQTSALVEQLAGLEVMWRWPTDATWLRIRGDGGKREAPSPGLLALLDTVRAAWWVADGMVDGQTVRLLRVRFPEATGTGLAGTGALSVDGGTGVVGLGNDGTIRSVEVVLADPRQLLTGRLVVRWELLAVGDPVTVTIPEADQVVDVVGSPGQ